MESFKIQNLSFAYPGRSKKALGDINFSVKPGEFITVCGKSGCGKTTLLRLLKPSVSPHGDVCGSIYFKNELLSRLDERRSACEIGFVMQSPENQIVTDKVWHELAFGLESLGYSTAEIRARVAEMASFFGIEAWFHKKVTELSGGQKQLLALASVMVMQPSVLLLDEPTSQLDPIAASEFLRTLEKINRELGIAVVMTEHRLEEAFPISDRIIVMDGGRIIADGTPGKVGDLLKSMNHDMYAAMPVPMRVYGTVDGSGEYPVSVCEGRCWLEAYSEKHSYDTKFIPVNENSFSNASGTAVCLRDVWFRYEKNLPDVIKGLNVEIYKGELYAIVGGNGTGKSTALSIISGLGRPYRGEVLVNGKKLSDIQNLYGQVLGVLPQNPQSLFVKKTVFLDLMEILPPKGLSEEEKHRRINEISALCRIGHLLESHPYDLSGGEQQRAALAKVLLQTPEILLLDEPTKGMDAHFKAIFADILRKLKSSGVTVIVVSHDIEFCAENADRCAMFFDGAVTSVGAPREFFAGKSFYTTSANRMARNVLAQAVLADDIVLAFGKSVQKRESEASYTYVLPEASSVKNAAKPKCKKLHPFRIIVGVIFALALALGCIFQIWGDDFGFTYLQSIDTHILQLVAIIELAGVIICFKPVCEREKKMISEPRKKSMKLSKRTIAAALMILIAIPLTIYLGVQYFDDRKYYFISLFIILETLIPFCMVFESRKPKARELVIISVLCAVAVAGRMAFFMLPQFKPVIALVIIAGIGFGGETGFLVGAVTGFVSNFFMGQGPWTPWQMFAFGIIGFIAGILFREGVSGRRKFLLCVFGGLATLVIYGGIMNPASVIMSQANLTWEMIASAYITGLPFDLVHAASTVFFLWFVSEPMLEKLERVKLKYGLIDGKN